MAGLTQKIMEGWTAGVDAFYKSSHSLLDEGQFGAALVESAFNYERGRQYGGEFTTNYDHGPSSAYGNVGWIWARGISWSSAQFLFDPNEFKLSRITGFSRSRPAHYCVARRFLHLADWKGAFRHPLRQWTSLGFANIRPCLEYSTVNLSLQRNLKIPKIGLFRSGSMLLTCWITSTNSATAAALEFGAPQFGQRRGFYGTVAYDF